MKKEDFYGKFFLREGDVRPEEIDERIYNRYGLTIKFLKHLKSIGLLFDNREEAMMHYKCIMGAMKKPVDKREFENLVPVWHRAFEFFTESGKEPETDKYILEEERGFLIKIQKGSFTARCLLLQELDKLPKEKGL